MNIQRPILSVRKIEMVLCLTLECSVSYKKQSESTMPVKFNTIPESVIAQIEEICDAENCGDAEMEEQIKSLFSQFRMYQENRLKINKESRESKKAARDAEGGGEGGSKRSKSAKMTGVVKLVAIEGQENTFKVEKVSLPAPAPAPKPQTEEEEDNAPLVAKPKPKFTFKKVAEPEINLAENPEALAEHLASVQSKPSAATLEARAFAEKWKKSEADRKKAEGIAKRKATLAAKKQQLADAAKAALAVQVKESESEDSGEETETDVETEDDE